MAAAAAEARSQIERSIETLGGKRPTTAAPASRKRAAAASKSIPSTSRNTAKLRSTPRTPFLAVGSDRASSSKLRALSNMRMEGTATTTISKIRLTASRRSNSIVRATVLALVTNSPRSCNALCRSFCASLADAMRPKGSIECTLQRSADPKMPLRAPAARGAGKYLCIEFRNGPPAAALPDPSTRRWSTLFRGAGIRL